MNSIYDNFDNMLSLITEEAGRGRGPQIGKDLHDKFEDIMRTISYDYLNRSTHKLYGVEKYNFNNYYTLDIRLDIDELVHMWENGISLYNEIFSGIYSESNKYERSLLSKIRAEYEAEYNEQKNKAALKNVKFKMRPLHKNPNIWISLSRARRLDAIEYIYNSIPTVSVYNPSSDSENETLAIKSDEFVPLIISGLKSAVRGHVPQGVTIEEILEGKFSKKAIEPDKGTFINKVKDPTSEKDFDFRSWKASTLEELHDIIMNVFKNDPRLSSGVGILKDGITRSSIFLYMKQEDFNRLEKGGGGFSKLAKWVANDLDKVIEAPKI
jgi:hypothetical protein